jgi:hypothetical protein
VDQIWLFNEYIIYPWRWKGGIAKDVMEPPPPPTTIGNNEILLVEDGEGGGGGQRTGLAPARFSTLLGLV